MKKSHLIICSISFIALMFSFYSNVEEKNNVLNANQNVSDSVVNRFVGETLFPASPISINSILEGSSSSSESLSSNEINSSSEINLPSEINSSSETNLSSDIVFDKKIKVYLNPSVQIKNLYVNNLGNEGKNMNDIVEYMVEDLCNVDYIDLKYNLSYLSLSESVSESNKFNADIHFALHSNAGGGKGSEIYTSKNNEFAKYIYDKYTKGIDNYEKRGVKTTSTLYEIKNSKAENRVLLELLFHDNAKEAQYIVDNKKYIADILSEGIKDYIKEFYFNIY